MTIDDLEVGDTFSAAGPGLAPDLQGKHWRVKGKDANGKVILDGPFEDAECTRRYHPPGTISRHLN